MNIFSAFDSFLVTPLLWSLIFFTHLFFNNLGLGILALTLIIRLVLTPLTLPSLKASKKQREISGELNELKKKYSGDKKKLAEEQMVLFRKHGINPAAGCLPQVAQIIVLLALYQVFIRVLGFNGHGSNLPAEYSFINTRFLYLDLLKKDPFILLPGLAGASQFLMSKMLLPVVKKEEKIVEKAEDKPDDLMYNMQEQMLYLGPAFTILISWGLPSGLVLYWLATTVFSIVQQWWVFRDRQLAA
ncbi:MAG: YidC/Oxa1 family membrane protein insertase [Patescibacteria group bacterium]|nr:YidC/Oxa1 family membrane protein insertase [Patescibacteria group bacterium]